MNIYRIFISNMGKFESHENYEFIADFADIKAVTQYIGYMRGRKLYAKKDIIIKVVPIDAIDTSVGIVDGVITVLGESLPIDEYEFT